MFTMDVPYVPMQEATIVLAQASTSGTGATLPLDYVLKVCQDTESTGEPTSAMRGVDPAYLLKNYIQNQVRHYVDIAAITNIALLEGTTHGILNAKTSGSGRAYYMYDPKPGYVGKDSAVFMAEFEGKRYKIVVDLNVFLMVDEKSPSTCPPPKLIKVNGRPVSEGGTYQLNSFTLTFGNLPGAPLGKPPAPTSLLT